MISNIRPVFVSAPQIRLSINNTLIAYAIGVNLNINIDAQSVYTFGDYGPINVEPLQYGVVTGTLQIVKLTPNLKISEANNAVVSVTNQRVSLSETISATGSIFTKGGDLVPLPGGNSNSPLVNEGLNRHIDPRKVLFSKTFDMTIKLSHITNIQGTNGSKGIQSSLLSVRNCRLSGVNMNISMGALVNEPLSFQGLLMLDEEKDDAAQETADSGRNEGG